MYRVTIDMTFDDEKDRDALYKAAQALRKSTSLKASGRIERHTCNHDTAEPCTNRELERWEAEA